MKSDSEINLVADLLKVVAEKNRLKILHFLKAGERCVCEIWPALGIPQNLASHHLKVLKNAGLISSRKDGLKIFYRLNKKVVQKHVKTLNKFF